MKEGQWLQEIQKEPDLKNKFVFFMIISQSHTLTNSHSSIQCSLEGVSLSVNINAVQSLPHLYHFRPAQYATLQPKRQTSAVTTVSSPIHNNILLA
jgi:hypothetical protein